MSDVPASVLSFYDSRIKVNLLKEYVEFLFDENLVDSKKSCLDMVSKLLSVTVDNGDCSIAVIEEIKQYINGYKIKSITASVTDALKDLSRDLVEDSTEDLGDSDLLSFPDEVSQKLKALAQAKQSVVELESFIYNLLGDATVKGVITNFLQTYAKMINSQFLAKFQK